MQTFLIVSLRLFVVMVTLGVSLGADDRKVTPVAIPEEGATLELRFGLVGKKTRFTKIVTSKGVEIWDCKVKRADPEGLIVRHRNGVMRVSFFDLPEWLQEEYNFDREEGLAFYKESLEKERLRRAERVKEKTEAERLEHEWEREKEIRREMQLSWTAVECRVIKRFDGVYLVRAKKVVWEPTKVKSRLGVWGDGPPKRTLVPLSEKPVYMVLVLDSEKMLRVGASWKGYFEPEPSQMIRFGGDEGGANLVEGYRAVEASRIW